MQTELILFSKSSRLATYDNVNWPDLPTNHHDIPLALGRFGVNQTFQELNDENKSGVQSGEVI